MQEVQTSILFTVPFWLTFTDCKLTSCLCTCCLCEKEILAAFNLVLPHIAHCLAIEIFLSITSFLLYLTLNKTQYQVVSEIFKKYLLNQIVHLDNCFFKPRKNSLCNDIMTDIKLNKLGYFMHPMNILIGQPVSCINFQT